MCGLSAIVELGSSDRLLRPLLDMHERIRHRGPDGEGFAVFDSSWRAVAARSTQQLRELAPAKLRVGLAFRWLQIQDPGETAAQPMASPDGAVWLTFNGEIYNFQELRQELMGLGHRFASVSDTEVLLAAYLQWGRECFARLNGMWAIIMVDLRTRKMLISRDRFGIKPLFYYCDRGRLSVASEIKQLLAAGAPARANRHALARFVRGDRPAVAEESFFADVFALPAASYCEIDLQEPAASLTFRPYWTLEVPELRGIARPSIGKAATALEALLARSVAEHLVAQAPLGHLISGGLDSSLLAALAAPIYEVRHEQGAGFSMVLGRAWRQLDESPYIDALAQALHFQSFKSELSPEWLKTNIERITWAQEEPVAGMAVAGQFLAYETAARHGARVVIDGQGADEFFAGYPRHQIAVLADLARRLALPSLAREAVWLFWRDRRFLWNLWQRRIARASSRGQPHRRDFLSIEADGVGRAAAPPRHASVLTRALLPDVLSYNLKSVLAMTDRNAMTHSIEARVPYVDWRIAEFAFALPDDYKSGHGLRKRILRVIGARCLPKAIVARTDRIGFGAPVEAWLKSDFRSEIAELPQNRLLGASALFDLTKFKEFIDGFLAERHRDFGTVWRAYAIDRWARAYGVADI
jgi:asparagine synthase (glutamine-hydrolysing)